MKESVLITIFTPIFNRKHTIHRVWESLISQTNLNFEWLIVNDGSTDGVEELLETYKRKADFPVRIIHQENGGKHMAINKAVPLAKGQLMSFADSDDSFDPTTVDVFIKTWNQYDTTNVAGITVLCNDEEGNLVGDKFPEEGVFNQVEIIYKYKITGEKWGCVRTDILKEHPFPHMEGAKFFPEGYIWDQISLKYDHIFLNNPLRTYFQDSGNQLTKDSNPSEGFLKIKIFYTIWWINNYYPRINKYISMFSVLNRFAYLWKTSFLLKRSFSETFGEMESTKNKSLAILMYLPTLIYFKLSNK